MRYQRRILTLAVSVIMCSSSVYCRQVVSVLSSPEVNNGKTVSSRFLAPDIKDVKLSSQLISGSKSMIKVGGENLILDNLITKGNDIPTIVLIQYGRSRPAISKLSDSLYNCDNMLDFLTIFLNGVFPFAGHELNNKRLKLLSTSRGKENQTRFTIREYLSFSYEKKTKQVTCITISEMYELLTENSSMKQLNYCLNNYIV
jgi:hypothetical protein